MNKKNALAEKLNKLKEAEEPVEEIKQVLVEKKPKEPKKLTFEEFKSLVHKALKEDIILEKMRIGTFENANELIFFQGVRNNKLARFTAGKIYNVYRALIRRRLNDLINQYYH